MSPAPLVILDRDGVLNGMVVDPEHGTIDSPLHPSQVEVFDWVPRAVKLLADAGFRLAIATNQPAAAKGKTTRENLNAVNQAVLARLGPSAGSISSHICFHRAEDRCGCRKPQTAMLEEALALEPGTPRSSSWMVGDGITDVEAGRRAGLRTAFLGPRKPDALKIMHDHDCDPVFWGRNLLEFVLYLTVEERSR